MTEFKVKGKITTILEKESGISKDGKEWTKQGFIVETDDKYNNIYAFGVFGADKVEQLIEPLKEGQEIEVDFNIRCNEWNGRYFTELQPWRINTNEQVPEPAVQGDSTNDPAGDLPF